MIRVMTRRELGTEAAVKAAGKYHMKGKVRFGT